MNSNTMVSDKTITITDLKNVLVIIDLAAQRGALRAAELSSVGALYEKINQFVQETEQKIKLDKEGAE
jgi:hypothetical protein